MTSVIGLMFQEYNTRVQESEFSHGRLSYKRRDIRMPYSTCVLTYIYGLAQKWGNSGDRDKLNQQLIYDKDA